MIRLLIAEDQAMLLSVLSALLDLEADLRVVFQASDGQQALNFLTDLKSSPVDIVITDIEMPKLSGIELAQAIRKNSLDCKTIIVTTFGRSGYLRRAMDAGVKGNLLKDSPSEVLLSAIRKVASGGKVIAPELMQDAWMEQDPLTDNERKALKLAGDGFSTEQIAQQLNLSSGTVRNYLSNASSKLGANNRIEACRIAQINGWL